MKHHDLTSITASVSQRGRRYQRFADNLERAVSMPVLRRSLKPVGVA